MSISGFFSEKNACQRVTLRFFKFSAEKAFCELEGSFLIFGTMRPFFRKVLCFECPFAYSKHFALFEP